MYCDSWAASKVQTALGSLNQIDLGTMWKSKAAVQN